MNPCFSILIIAALLAVPTVILNQENLLKASVELQQRCMEKNSLGFHVCISCVERKSVQMHKDSNMIFEDTVDYRVLTIPSGGLLSCEELLQFTAYSLPVSDTSQIELQKIASIQDLVDLLQIEFSMDVYNYTQISPAFDQVALIQVKEQIERSDLHLTYSPKKSLARVQDFIQIISGLSIIASIIVVGIYIVQDGILKISIVGSLVISSMLLVNASMPRSEYLTMYSYSLFVLVCLVIARPNRILTVATLIASICLMMIYHKLLCFLTALLVFRVSLTPEIYKKQSAFITYVFIILAVISFFEKYGQKFLPVSLCQIYSVTFICFAPIFIEILAAPPKKVNYQEVPGASTVSLPGFEENDEEENN